MFIHVLSTQVINSLHSFTCTRCIPQGYQKQRAPIQRDPTRYTANTNTDPRPEAATPQKIASGARPQLVIPHIERGERRTAAIQKHHQKSCPVRPDAFGLEIKLCKVASNDRGRPIETIQARQRRQLFESVPEHPPFVEPNAAISAAKHVAEIISTVVRGWQGSKFI